MRRPSGRLIYYSGVPSELKADSSSELTAQEMAFDPSETGYTMFTRPPTLLRIEEAALLTAAILLYAYLHYSWLLFAVLFLFPDLFLLGYLVNPRTGSAIYNLGHAIFVPLTLFAVAVATHRPLLSAIAIIWFSHISFDRILGYGLKYPAHFKDTHLQHLT